VSASRPSSRRSSPPRDRTPCGGPWPAATAPVFVEAPIGRALARRCITLPVLRPTPRDHGGPRPALCARAGEGVAQQARFDALAGSARGRQTHALQRFAVGLAA